MYHYIEFKLTDDCENETNFVTILEKETFLTDFKKALHLWMETNIKKTPLLRIYFLEKWFLIGAFNKNGQSHTIINQELSNDSLWNDVVTTIDYLKSIINFYTDLNNEGFLH